MAPKLPPKRPRGAKTPSKAAKPPEKKMGNVSKAADGDRIAKYLARAGIASRRDSEKLILEGRVKVNGVVLDTPAFKVTANDLDRLSKPAQRPAARHFSRASRYYLGRAFAVDQ